MHHHAPDSIPSSLSEEQQFIIQALRPHAPFNQMQPPHLHYLVAHCTQHDFTPGSIVLSPEMGQVQHWFLLIEGTICAQRSATPDDQTFYLGSGDSFPLVALQEERATRTHYIAQSPCSCVLLSRDAFNHLLEQSDPFRLFMREGSAMLLDKLRKQARLYHWQEQHPDTSLNTPLAHFVQRVPITCTTEHSLGDVVGLMHEHNVSSVAITNAAQQLLGIFTLRDLRRVFSQNLAERDQPIGQLMTLDPYHLSPRHTAYDAAMLMIQHNIGHLCVCDNQKLVGVLSERDLFDLQRINLVQLSRALRHAENLQDLRQLRQRIPRLVQAMLANEASAPQVTHLITQLNDHSTLRIIELILADSPPALPIFCWLSFGSEGRHEQTLLTDQDNGLMFYTPEGMTADDCRQALLPVARRINEALDSCGLTLCTGNIMASNPELCLSAEEWLHKFRHIILQPDPEHLLQGSIFFDLRVLWGDQTGVDALLPELLALIADSPQFQRMMANNALRYRLPLQNPLQRLGRLLQAHEPNVDLKAGALSPFVDSVRIFALSNGISEASTLERLHQLGEHGIFTTDDANAFHDAYSYLQLLRLQLHLRQTQQNQPLNNQLPTAELNPLERRMLRESLRQAKHLQDLLRHRYQL
ncbi:DUF294 nucleotidyltransferase-like domain-containing protein [Paenalcaligenes sp. Me131]|uniref:DUF294 nucleotidyltransferase-like domain-containing protein n=1 Tax=Paenalcaligenes sp. Me131 TaxID=3392636 RepID=UPI003D2B9F9E